MENFCNSTFWDLDITWNTDDPDFTDCFEKTACLWPVCSLFWIAAILDACRLKIEHSSNFSQPLWRPAWTWKGGVKVGVISVIVFLEVTGLILNWYDVVKRKDVGFFLVPNVLWTTPVVLITTHIVSSGLVLLHKSRCVHTSGIQLLHWFSLSLVTGLTFRTEYKTLHLSNEDNVIPLVSLILLGIIFGLMLLQTFIFCWADIPASQPGDHTLLHDDDQHLEDENEKDAAQLDECPMSRCSCLSYILFSWSTPLLRKGYKTPLTATDLWKLIPSVRSSVSFKLFQKQYGSRQFGETRGIFRNIILPLWHTSGGSFCIAVVCKMISTLLTYLSPKVMGFVIDFVQDKEIQLWKGYLWALSLLLIYWLVCIFMEQFLLHMYQCNLNIFSCLNMIIYKKSMNASSDSRRKTTTGQLVNLMSVDVETIREVIYSTDAVWSCPIQVTIGVFLLWNELGIAVVPGLAVICATIPVTWWLSAKTSRYQREEMQKKDERIKIISEVLSGMQVVKLYAWEHSFIKQIEKVRAEEVNLLKKRSFCQSGIQLVLDSVPFLVSTAAFFTFVYINGGILDPKKAFSAVILFNLLTEPITTFPASISAMIDARVSFKRVNDFLNAEEIHPAAINVLPKLDDNDNSEFPQPVVEVVNGTFLWEEETNNSASTWKLTDINLKVKSTTLTAVVGSVACGKSSLLSALLGEMKYSGQHVAIRGTVAYVPQIAWILNTTLRENICFGLPYNEEKYRAVVEACCLTPDIGMLSAGDQTEIGEKGINLSGGQKQRVSLARAVYSEADVLLLDDVLSAVDSQVGKHIFDKLLGHFGLLRHKTRILCTHAYQYLSQVDSIVVLEEGRIIENGTYSELLSHSGRFSELLSTYIQSQELEGGSGDGDRSRTTSCEDVSSVGDHPSSTKTVPPAGDSGKLIEEELMETGDVKASVMLAYVNTMGYPLAVAFVILFGASQAFSLSRNIVLSKWTGSSSHHHNTSSSLHYMDHESTSYAVEYGILGICQSVSYFFGYYLLLCISSIKAANLLHNGMLQRIMQAPMKFFNVTPLGRITNRFSADVEKVDKRLPGQIGDWICHIYKFIVIIVAIIFATNYYFILYIVPVSVVYYILQRYYIACMQQLERIRSVARSPLYAQFQETLSGTSTLRAYKAQERFLRMLGKKLDTVNRAEFPHLIVRRWLSIRLGFLGSTVVFIPALFAILWRDTIDPSLVGLSISYAVQMTNILSWLIKVTSYVRYNFVGAERILEYSKVEQEADFYQGRKEGPKKWPDMGEISFIGYETTYRPGLELVLKQFTCQISAGEKVGIVGRTGAGKSSLTLAMFRIIEAVQGEILIDGVNIADLGLHQVRKRLAVIPQDPVLFSRSLRLNLDPFEEFEDIQIWEALEMAHLKKYVDGLEGQLEFQVAEGGENLSVGQRQLVCLARAILRKSPILILDEATASVDSVTDELIQKTIRDHFEDCTILNVAHRLNTVLDSTRILVLHRGQVAEFDTPQNLLANPDSHFFSMARDAGIISK